MTTHSVEFALSTALIAELLNLPSTSEIVSIRDAERWGEVLVIVSDPVRIPEGHHFVQPIVTKHYTEIDYNVHSGGTS